MKQIKIFKKYIGLDIDLGIQLEELQKEVNNYIRTIGYVYNPEWRRYEQNGASVINVTPLSNGHMLMIVLEMETQQIIE